jgi:hypothetical protein
MSGNAVSPMPVDVVLETRTASCLQESYCSVCLSWNRKGSWLCQQRLWLVLPVHLGNGSLSVSIPFDEMEGPGAGMRALLVTHTLHVVGIVRFCDAATRPGSQRANKSDCIAQQKKPWPERPTTNSSPAAGVMSGERQKGMLHRARSGNAARGYLVRMGH